MNRLNISNARLMIPIRKFATTFSPSTAVLTRLRRLAWAKDRAPDADHRRAFFNGYAVIVGHAHAQHRPMHLWEAGSQRVTQLAQSHKHRSRLFGILHDG